jgi:hypothetical protein
MYLFADATLDKGQEHQCQLDNTIEGYLRAIGLHNKDTCTN